MCRVRALVLSAFISALALAGCTPKPSGTAPGTGPTPAAPPASNGGALKIGYVLHGLNDFTQVIKRGADNAGTDLQVHVDATGPAGFVATDAIGIFEGMVQKKEDGLAVIPMPGEVWVTPIKAAVDAKIPVVTANITSPGSAAEAWFGQDEYKSGVILATELRKILEADGKTSGKIR